MNVRKIVVSILPVLVVIGLAPEITLADRPQALSAQTVKVQSGPTSLTGLGESFSHNIATGTGGYSVPISVPPGIMTPTVSVSYSGGRGRGLVGMGFDLPTLNIYRTTDKGLPHYTDEDRFAVSGGAFNDELVVVNKNVQGNGRESYYRLKNESSFALFVRHTLGDGDYWEIRLRSGYEIVLGNSGNSRQYGSGGTAKWFVSEERNNSINEHKIRYLYTKFGGGRLYLDEIRYQEHASYEYQNAIKFTWIKRQDKTRDYRYGVEIKTDRILESIYVRHGGKTIREYNFSYETNQLYSVLKQINMVGSEGTPLPPLTFDYWDDKGEGAYVINMNRAPELESLVTRAAVMEDINGDSLPDILYGTDREYYYYENINGYTWSENRIIIRGNRPDVGLHRDGVMLADINGDGYRDVVVPVGGSSSNGFNFYPGGNIEDGKFEGFGEYKTLDPLNTKGVDWDLPDKKLVDLNYDGRTDILVQENNTIWQIINHPGKKSDYLTEEEMGEVNLDIDFSDPRISLQDFNGDGILDIVEKEIKYNPDHSRVRVWFGKGFGTYTSSKDMTGVPRGFDEDFYFSDVNRDGQTDLLKIDGDDIYYRLNSGNLSFLPYRKVSNTRIPVSWEAEKIFFADMNGNGSTDIVWIRSVADPVRNTSKYFTYCDLYGMPHFGLLKSIDNGLGKVTTISYRSSTDYMVDAKLSGKPWKTPMPSPQSLISKIETTDSFGKIGLKPTVTTTTYDYRDGYFDAKEREFRGYAEVTATSHGDEHQGTAVTKTWLHVGRNLKTGEDEEILKGKAYRQEVFDDMGRRYQSVETKWERHWLCQEDLSISKVVLPRCQQYHDKQEDKDHLVAFAIQTESLTGAWDGTWDGTVQPEFTGIANLEWDRAWGDVTKSAAYGKVSFPGSHKPGDPFSLAQADVTVGNDETIVQSERIYNVEDWLIGLIKTKSVLDKNENVVAQTRTYYDGKPFEGLTLGLAKRGWVTREQAWLKEEDRWIDTKRMSYNDSGQVVATKDALDNLVQLEYDQQVGTFPSVERICLDDAESCLDGSGKTLAYKAEYDTSFGTVLQTTDFNGNTSFYCYDDLSRFTRFYDPLAVQGVQPEIMGERDPQKRNQIVCQYGQPSIEYRYDFGNPISTTTVTTLVDRQENTYRTSWIYSDGLGRGRMTKTEAEGEDPYLASGWQELSKRGGVIRKFESFPTKNLGLEKPDLSQMPYTESFYDILGRPTEVFPPASEHGRTHILTEYRPFETWVYDEQDILKGDRKYPAISRTDGLGRVTEIIKHNDIGGVRTPLTWSVDYDTLGNITSFSDPIATVARRDGDWALADKHTRYYQYDSLGRMVFLTDPNVNNMWYGYNDRGDIVWRTDSKDQVQQWIYGVAGRLDEHRAWTEGQLEPPSVTKYHYDRVDAYGPFADELVENTNLKGQLAWVEWPTGSHHAVFDPLGRVTAEAETLWNPQTSTPEQREFDTFVQTYGYNAAGELIEQSSPGGLDLRFDYNKRSLLRQVSGGFAGAERTIFDKIKYDHRGMILSTRQGNDTATCAWHNDRAELTDFLVGPAKAGENQCDNPDASKAFLHVNYKRNPTGLISEIIDRSSLRPDVPRLDASYTYDRLYQLTQANIRPSTNIDDHHILGYTYDAIQNLTSRNYQTGSENPGNNTNPNSNIDLPIGEFKYGERTNGPNQITSAGGRAFDYDSVGQMKRYNGYNLTFDPAGRLVQAQNEENGRTIEYHYDDLGEKKITIIKDKNGEIEKVYRYIFENYQIRDGDPTWIVTGGLGQLEITKSQGIRPDANLIDQLERYVDDFTQTIKPVPEEYLDLDQDGDQFLDQQDIKAAQQALMYDERVGGEKYIWRYIHKDHLGGTTHTSDSAGDLISHQRFRPYGKIADKKGIGSTYGFAGGEIEEEEELGLSRFGARWYAPEIGRWVSGDLLFLTNPAKNVNSVLEGNLYQYTCNNPLNFIDDEGSETKTRSPFYPLGKAMYDSAVGISKKAKSGIDKLAGEIREWAGGEEIKNRAPVTEKDVQDAQNTAMVFLGSKNEDATEAVLDWSNSQDTAVMYAKKGNYRAAAIWGTYSVFLNPISVPTTGSLKVIKGEISSAAAVKSAAGRPDAAIQTYWPPNRGFEGKPIKQTLNSGAVIDRYGHEGGSFVSPKGTPYGARALAPGSASKPYNVYEVVKPFEVNAGKATSWFGELGGGIQYELPMSVTDAIEGGFIRKVTP